MRILKYLAGTTDVGLTLKRDTTAPQLKAYVDAAFADTVDCKSTAGWLYLFQGALIAYDSTTIKRVVTSSTEAECCALVMVAKENIWQRRIVNELTGIPMVPTPVYGDNSASITMLGSGMTKRSRHYDIEWHYMRDRMDTQEFTMTWVPTEDNLADFFTKKLPRQRFIKLRDQVMHIEGRTETKMDEEEQVQVCCAIIDGCPCDLFTQCWITTIWISKWELQSRTTIHGRQGSHQIGSGATTHLRSI